MNDRGKIVQMGGRRAPRPQLVTEFAEIARRMQDERVAAANVVERLLRDTPTEQWRDLAGRPELRTSGALEKLGNYVTQALGRDPRQALTAAQLAMTLCETLDGEYPAVVVAQLSAHAAKDLAKALLYLGRFDEALSALDVAEARVAAHGALAHDLAIVRVVRATLLHEINRYDDAFALLAECKEVFREHHDHKRLLLCGINEGVLLHRMRRYREAREAYLLLLPATADSGDRDAMACLYNVIGHCSVDLGDFTAAEMYLSRAIELFHTLGQPLQAAKAELGRGRMFVRRGDVQRGIAHLRPIRADFMRHRMTEEAGLCGLEIVDALLARSAAGDAEALARQIIVEFTAAALNQRAISALGYLTEAIAARKASRDLVTTVREYIVSLRTSPERPFAFV
ncbi:MAG TPA: tetratricopeptide repeat protein [Thermoanaerobaculia bacterium]|nr:tetratricopeptide repeat protein [Thermoanaerobaculia bacterium]